MPSLCCELSQPNCQRVFTLVELLLAVALSAVVAALAYAGISAGMQAANAMAAQVESLTELQRAFSIIEEDLVQSRLRGLTLGLGYHEAAFVTPVENSMLLSLTRGGVANPRQLARSDLQRVRYELHGDALWRAHWPQLDRSDAQEQPQQLLLLQGVSRASLEFLPATAAGAPVTMSAVESAAGLWQNSWDSDAPQHALTAPLPIAVRVTLDTRQYGQVQRVFELP